MPKNEASCTSCGRPRRRPGMCDRCRSERRTAPITTIANVGDSTATPGIKSHARRQGRSVLAMLASIAGMGSEERHG